MGALCTLITDVVASIQEAHDNKAVSLKEHKNAFDNGMSTQSGYETTATNAKGTEAEASQSNAADAAKNKRLAQQLEIAIVRTKKQLADSKDQLREEKKNVRKEGQRLPGCRFCCPTIYQINPDRQSQTRLSVQL